MLTIRKTGGASAVTLPKSLLRSMNLDNGSKLTYTIENGAIVLRPVVEQEKLTIEQLLDGVEDGEYCMSPEEREEFEVYPAGKENL